MPITGPRAAARPNPAFAPDSTRTPPEPPSPVLRRGARAGLFKRLNLLTPAEEAFAQAVARGLSYGAAAQEAGYAVDPKTGQPRGNVQRLLKSERMAERVKQLVEEHEASRKRVLAKISDATRENVLVDLLETREQAKQTGNLVARTRCNELIGKEIGMFVTRVEGTVVHALDGVSSDIIRAALDVLARGSVTVIDSTTIDIVEDAPDDAPDGSPTAYGPTPVPELAYEELDPLS